MTDIARQGAMDDLDLGVRTPPIGCSGSWDGCRHSARWSRRSSSGATPSLDRGGDSTTCMRSRPAWRRRAADGEPVLGRADGVPGLRRRPVVDANCAWITFGICAALHVDGRIETACADCGDLIIVEARSPAERQHVVVPLPVSRGAVVGRHRLHLEAFDGISSGRKSTSTARLVGRARSGPRPSRLRQPARRSVVGRPARSPGWRPHTREQNQAISGNPRLTGPFWQLPERRAACSNCSSDPARWRQ